MVDHRRLDQGDAMWRAEQSSDAELVTAALDGSAAATRALYTRYVATVRHVATDNVRDPSDIDDVTQEVFARAFHRLPSLRNTERFRPWLLQIARRVAIDARRARCRRPVHVAVDEIDLVDHQATPDLEAEVRVLADAVQHGLTGLRTRDATVLTMVVELGFSLDEVAAGLGLSYTNAKVLLHRARSRLREAVDAELTAQVG